MKIFPGKKFNNVLDKKFYRVLNGKVECLSDCGKFWLDSEYTFSDLYNKEIFREA